MGNVNFEDYIHTAGYHCDEVCKRKLFGKLALEIAKEEGLSLYTADWNTRESGITLSKLTWCQLGYISNKYKIFENITSMMFGFSRL